MVPVRIITIGSEILLGQVQDTNTHWLCTQITNLGGKVQKSVTIPDDYEEIKDELNRSLSKKCIVITTGGLGPTEDDMTLRAISAGLGRKFKLNREAYQMVAKRYKKLAEAAKVESPAMTEARKKMAMFPGGGVPLYNSVGTAPGMYLEYGNSRIFCLPGVPQELKAIFKASLHPILEEVFRPDFYLQKELLIDLNDESKLAPILKKISLRWPNVYIKSRPGGFGQKNRLTVTLSMTGKEGKVKEILNQIIDELDEKIGIEKVG